MTSRSNRSVISEAAEGLSGRRTTFPVFEFFLHLLHVVLEGILVADPVCGLSPGFPGNCIDFTLVIFIMSLESMVLVQTVFDVFFIFLEHILKLSVLLFIRKIGRNGVLVRSDVLPLL